MNSRVLMSVSLALALVLLFSGLYHVEAKKATKLSAVKSYGKNTKSMMCGEKKCFPNSNAKYLKDLKAKFLDDKKTLKP